MDLSVKEEKCTTLPTPSIITDVKDSLEMFVKCFVDEVERKLLAYSLVLDGRGEKAGKFSDSYAEPVGQATGLVGGGLLGLLASLPTAGAKIGSNLGKTAVGKLASYMGKESHKNKVFGMSDIVYNFQDNKTELRLKLVKIGYDLFRSYEMQFMGVSFDNVGHRKALQLLAIDATNRLIDYCSRGNILKTDAVLFGESKVERTLGMPLPDVKIKTPGFNLNYKCGAHTDEWKTSSMFTKSGLIIEANDPTKPNKYYRMKKKSKTGKYGYRRLFNTEKWEDIKDRFEHDDEDEANKKFRKYIFIIKTEDMEETKKEEKKIFDEINKKDSSLTKEEMTKKIENARRDLLNELQEIKENHKNEFEKHHDLLESVATYLQELNIDVWVENLQQDVVQIKSILNELNNKQDEGIKGIKEILDRQNIEKEEVEPIRFETVNSFKPVLTFTGRVTELEDLYKSLHTENKRVVISQVALVTGLGGIGKTELAKKYAYEYRNFYKNMVWINAATTENIRTSFKKLAEELNIPINKDGEKVEREMKLIVEEIYKKLNKRGPTLIIFDNAEEQTDINDFLFSIEKKDFHLLITSRNCKWDGGEEGEIKLMEINTFKPEEAREYVSNYLEIGDEYHCEINSLIKTLQYFPLALKQAVSYIKQENRTKRYRERHQEGFKIGDYLKEYEKNASKLLDYNGNNRYTDTIMNTWTITIERIKEIEKEERCDKGLKAEDFLKVIAYMAPDEIIIESIFLEDNCVNWNSIELLHQYSMINLDRGIVSIHRLVQQVIILINRKEEEVERALQIINKAPKCRETELPAMFVWKYASRYERLFIRNVTSTYGRFKVTPLHLLAEQNESEAITTIMNYPIKIDLDFKDVLGRTALFVAAAFGQLEAVKVLVENGADLDAKVNYSFNGISDWTILHQAVQNGEYLVVEYLVNKGVNVYCQDGLKRDPYFIALTGEHYRIIKFLDKNNEKHLNTLAANGDLKSFEKILEGKSKEEKKRLINSLGEKTGPLHWAAQYGHLELVKFLVENGADCHQLDPFRLTPFHIAVAYSLDVTKFFAEQILQSNCKFDISKTYDEHNFSVLHMVYYYCCCCSQIAIDTLKYLIDKFSENKEESYKKDLVNVVNLYGETPLYTCAIHGRLGLVEYLVNAGANINLEDKLGITPLFAAALEGRYKIAEYLLSTNKDIKINGDPSNFIGKLELTPLHAAALNNNFCLAKLLIENNADVNAGRGVSFTPWHIANFFRYSNLSEYLLEKNADTAVDINFENIVHTVEFFQNDWNKKNIKLDFIDRIAKVSSHVLSYVVSQIHLFSQSIHKESVLSFLARFNENMQLLKKYIENRNFNAPVDFTDFVEMFGSNNTETPAEPEDINSSRQRTELIENEETDLLPSTSSKEKVEEELYFSLTDSSDEDQI